MSTTVFILVLVVVLFLLNFFMKRRFGLLGFALAAGALVSAYWAETLTPVLIGQGLPATQSQVEIALTLIPALILLFSGPTYGKIHMQVIGSALFTLLALALLLKPLGALMQFDEMGMATYMMLDKYQGTIIVVGLLVAIVDVFMGRSPGGGHRSKKADH